MRRSAAVLLLAGLAVSGVTACGSDATDASADGTATTAAGGSGSDTGSSSFDCAALQSALADLGGPTIQILPQLKTADVWANVAAGTPPIDLVTFQNGIEGLRPLEALPRNGAKMTEGLDIYAEAATLAQEAQASDNPVESDAGQALIAATADVPTFLSHQVTIGLAFDEAGCKVQ
jgi:hypothetical protein